MSDLLGIQRVITPEQLGLDRYDHLSLEYDPTLRAFVLRAHIQGSHRDLEVALWRLRYEIELMERDVRKGVMADA